MAYCRFNDTCKVYMYSSVLGGYQFHISGFADPYDGKTDFNVEDPEEALRILIDMREKNYGIPDYALERLKEEIGSSS